MWSAMLSAVLDVFGSLDHVIMCMSHNARMLGGSGGLNFDRPLGNLYWRNSDDYALNYSQTHTDHVRKNVYMTALSRHLSFKPDFDMFASTPSSAWPTYHALLRCLSPGPILLSDTPRDETDLALLGKMTAKGRNGATQVVKTDTAVQVLPNRLFWDNLAGPGEGPAVVGSVAFPTAQGSLIAAWNCHDPDSRGTAMDTIRMIDVEDALDEVIYDPNSRDLSTRGSRVASSGRGIDGEYAIWSVGHSARNGQKVELVQPGGRLEFGLELRSGECELLVVAKTYVIKGQKVAVVGMLDKIAPLAGVSVSVGHSEPRSQTREAAADASRLARHRPAVCGGHLRARLWSCQHDGQRGRQGDSRGAVNSDGRRCAACQDSSRRCACCAERRDGHDYRNPAGILICQPQIVSVACTIYTSLGPPFEPSMFVKRSIESHSPRSLGIGATHQAGGPHPC